MKKVFFFFLLIQLALGISAQNYTFKRASSDMGNTKMSGEISITGDTILLISSVKPMQMVSQFEISLSYNNGVEKQFFAVFPEEANARLRLTLTDPYPISAVLKKGETGMLKYEYIDDFTNKSSTLIYFLIPKK